MCKQVLFICAFNLQRSVAAEYFFHHLLSQDKPDYTDRIEAVSAGYVGKETKLWFKTHEIPFPDPLFERTPSEVAQDILMKWGIDISRHRSRPADKSILQRSDLIIPMMEILKRDILFDYPEVEPKIVLPRELLKEDVEFFWEDSTAVPNDSRMYEFAHFNRDYVSAQLNEVVEFVQRGFPEIISRLLAKGDKIQRA